MYTGSVHWHSVLTGPVHVQERKHLAFQLRDTKTVVSKLENVVSMMALLLSDQHTATTAHCPALHKHSAVLCLQLGVILHLIMVIAYLVIYQISTLFTCSLLLPCSLAGQGVASCNAVDVWSQLCHLHMFVLLVALQCGICSCMWFSRQLSSFGPAASGREQGVANLQQHHPRLLLHVRHQVQFPCLWAAYLSCGLPIKHELLDLQAATQHMHLSPGALSSSPALTVFVPTASPICTRLWSSCLWCTPLMWEMPSCWGTAPPATASWSGWAACLECCCHLSTGSCAVL